MFDRANDKHQREQALKLEDMVHDLLPTECFSNAYTMQENFSEKVIKPVLIGRFIKSDLGTMKLMFEDNIAPSNGLVDDYPTKQVEITSGTTKVIAIVNLSDDESEPQEEIGDSNYDDIFFDSKDHKDKKDDEDNQDGQGPSPGAGHYKNNRI